MGEYLHRFCRSTNYTARLKAGEERLLLRLLRLSLVWSRVLDDNAKQNALIEIPLSSLYLVPKKKLAVVILPLIEPFCVSVQKDNKKN